MALLFRSGDPFHNAAGTGPNASGKIVVYENNTTTRASLFADPDLSTAATTDGNGDHPLDAAGRLAHSLYGARGASYSVVERSSADADIDSYDDYFGVSHTNRPGALTLAAAKALTTLSDGDVITTSGRSALADGGSTDYWYVASSTTTANDVTVVDLDSLPGRLLMLENGMMSAPQMGILGDGGDDTAAFANIATIAPAAMSFRNLTYKVWPTGTLAGGEVLVSLSGRDGLTIDGRGASISIEDTFDTGEVAVLFKLDNCSNITIKNFDITGEGTLSTSIGYKFLEMTNGTHNVRVENITQDGGLLGIVCARGLAEAESTKVKNVVIKNYKVDNCAYPLSFQNSGDHVEVHAEIGDHQRAYFPYGVRNHDINLELQDGGTSPTCNLTVLGYDNTTNYLEDINLNLTIKNVDSSSAPNIVGLIFQHDGNGSVSGGVARNIHVHFNYAYNDIASLHAAFVTQKTAINPSAIPDTTGSRGWMVENLTITGTINNEDDSTTIVRIAGAADGTWTGETFQNVQLGPFVVTGSGATRIEASGIPFLDALCIEGLDMPGSASSSITTFTKGVRVKSSTIDGVYYGDGWYPETATGTFTASAHGLTQIDSGSGAVTVTLPDGDHIGQEKTIQMVNQTNSSTVSVTNHVTSAPEVFTFNAVGDMLVLRWNGSAWYTAENNSVTT